MKKVFLMAALVLASVMGSYSEANASSLMPVKKTTAKKTTTKKSTSTKKTATTSTKKATTASTSKAATTSTSTSSQSDTKSGLTGLLGALGSVGEALNGVIGGDLTQSNLCATWKYSGPGCAFTSENLLAKAGGSVASAEIKKKLSTYYTKAGFKSSNTTFTFNEDGTFESKIDGKSWNGKYTFDEKTGEIHLNGVLLKMSGYATKSSNGISLLFESKKLLTLVQSLSKLSGNSTLATLGNLSKNYSGVRVGFDLKK